MSLEYSLHFLDVLIAFLKVPPPREEGFCCFFFEKNDIRKCCFSLMNKNKLPPRLYPTHATTVQISYTKTSKTSTLSCEGRTPGKYRIPGACSYYLSCTVLGSATVSSCDKHRNFHPVLRTCVWTYLYGCDETDFCAKRGNGKYANVNNCYGYYHCVEGMTFPQQCAPGLRFDGYKCVDASRYVCPTPLRITVVPS